MIQCTLCNNLLIAKSGVLTTEAVAIAGLECACTLFVQSNYGTTSGTINVVYELSNDNINWGQVASLSAVLTGFTKTSGPASDGKIFLYFDTPLAAWLRFKVTETGTADPVQITMVLGVA